MNIQSNPTISFRIAPLAAALLLGGSLLAGCQRDDTAATDAQTTADATAPDATTPPGAMNDATDANGMPTGDVTADSNMAGDSMASDSMAGDSMAADGSMATGPVSDAQFYQQALDGGRKEVALSQMASQQSDDADVKRVAEMLVSDHTAMNQKLEAAAGTAAPADTGTDATATASLRGKTGDDFDSAYIDMMVSDHQKTIAMFENAATNASSDAARKLASDALPKLREHLQAVQQLQQASGGMTP